MRILGVNAIGHHDASACLVEGGTITAFAEEERFTRTKHAILERPLNSVRWILSFRDLSWRDIDILATPWIEEEQGVIAPPGYDINLSFGYREIGPDLSRWPHGLRELISDLGCSEQDAPVLVQVSHHLAHAASAYWCGDMDEAAILVIDGEGDRVSTTIAHGRAGRITSIRQFSTTESLGQFYASVTSFLGLGDFGEGKLMGLAPYGQADLDFPEIRVDEDGGYAVNLPGLRRFDPSRTDWTDISGAWLTALSERFGPRRPRRDSPAPTRLSDWAKWDRDLAASAQRTLEETLVHLARAATRLTGSSNLLLCGGVGLNCAANGRLAALPEVDGFFVQPIAGDSGAPIGAALQAAVLGGDSPMHLMRSIALGPAFSVDDCAAAVVEAGLTHRRVDDVASESAQRLARGQIVCWHQGALEGGPRALGHRSILASPHSVELRDRVNDVKRRARWRPLAPSVREEDVEELFCSGRRSPFMILADEVVSGWRDRLPGVTHVDNSARPQTVSRSVDPLYWSVLDRFRALTGLPAVINTSFNGEDEPIVCTPAEAVRTFIRSGADALCLGPFLAERPSWWPR